MIGSLINRYTRYPYDNKFYRLVDGAKFSLTEAAFIYSIFFIDLLILFTSIILTLFFAACGIAWIFGIDMN